MRILVTRGAGFIGSHLCDQLLEDGHELVIVDDLSLGVESNIAHLSDRTDVDFHHLSMLEPDFDAIVKGGKLDCVFHLAASSDIQAGSRDRLRMLATGLLRSESDSGEMRQRALG